MTNPKSSERRATESVKSLPFGTFIGQPVFASRGDGWSALLLRDNPLEEVPLHEHGPAHFCYVERGRYETNARDVGPSCPASTMLFHPAGVVHRDRFAERGGTFMTVSLSDAWLNDLDANQRLPNHSVGVSDRQVKWVGARTAAELRDPDPWTPLTVEGLVLQLIAELARWRTPGRGSRPSWLREATAFVHDNLCRSISVSDIASAADVHPVHLARGFRRFLGCSPSEYLRDRRIQLATLLLADFEVPLSSIAFRCGFFDQSHFTRTFKRATGTTPGRYRDVLKG